jgi:hypothetical protein
MEAHITRSKVYHRRGRVAWTWCYAVHIEGYEHPFKGTGIGWARDLAKRKGATTITYEWK